MFGSLASPRSHPQHSASQRSVGTVSREDRRPSAGNPVKSGQMLNDFVLWTSTRVVPEPAKIGQDPAASRGHSLGDFGKLSNSGRKSLDLRQIRRTSYFRGTEAKLAQHDLGGEHRGSVGPRRRAGPPAVP